MNIATSLRTRLATRWLIIAGLLVVAVPAALVFTGCGHPTEAATRTLYRCPMHPDYVSDKPGDCPICGMRLVPFQNGSSPKKAPATQPATNTPKESAPQPAREPAVVGASMQQPVTPPQAVPATRQPAAPASGQPMPDMPGMPGTPLPPTGASKGPDASGAGSAVHLDADRSTLAGVRTVAAARGTAAGTIRAVGTVVTPETGVRQITTKVAGWVQKLYVNSTGRPVRAGEPLFDLYSPELLATQQEYLHARQVAAQFSASTVPEVRSGGQDLIASARRRLELFDVPADFLRRLDETGQAQRTVTFRAPFGGYVMEKTVVEGQRVEPGMNLMTITDLSRAWVTAQVYEAEAAAARVGRAARVSLPYDDSVRLAGRIDLVYPTLDAESRTLKVRLQFPNPRLTLKPGMFVNVELDVQRADGIVVPDSAVIDTGTRQVVFVETQAGHFEPRDVQVALRGDGKAVLRSGVAAGEQVAVAANFLLDSESRLRGAVR